MTKFDNEHSLSQDKQSNLIGRDFELVDALGYDNFGYNEVLEHNNPAFNWARMFKLGVDVHQVLTEHLSYSLAISLVDALGQDNLDFYLTESDEIYSIVWLLDTFEKNMKVRLINVSSFTLGFWRETSAILFACLISPIQYTLDLITRTGVESGIFDNEAMNLYILLQLHKREHQRRINHGGGRGADTDREAPQGGRVRGFSR